MSPYVRTRNEYHQCLFLEQADRHVWSSNGSAAGRPFRKPKNYRPSIGFSSYLATPASSSQTYSSHGLSVTAILVKPLGLEPLTVVLPDLHLYNLSLRPPILHSCLAFALTLHMRGWRRNIVGRTLVSAGELSLSCARLLAGRVTTLWLRRPLSVSQHGQLSHPSLRGQ